MRNENEKDPLDWRAQPAGIAETPNVWRAPGIDVEPEVILRRWQIHRVLKSRFDSALGDHFVGWNATQGEGRVSTTITQLDPVGGLGITRSGRIYQLHGPAGQNRDAAHVWRVWCQHAGVDKAIDVTAEYVTLLAKA